MTTFTHGQYSSPTLFLCSIIFTGLGVGGIGFVKLVWRYWRTIGKIAVLMPSIALFVAGAATFAKINKEDNLGDQQTINNIMKTYHVDRTGLDEAVTNGHAESATKQPFTLYHNGKVVHEGCLIYTVKNQPNLHYITCEGDGAIQPVR